MPTTEWHEKAHGRRWYPGDTISHVIGQGDLKVSPLQLTLVYAAIANGGKLLSPQLIMSVSDSKGNIVKTAAPKIKRMIDLKPETLAAVQAGLAAAVNEPGGTAYLSRLVKPKFAGKTGTAQVIRFNADIYEQADYVHKDHAWFVGYGPIDDPEIVVLGMVEHGEHGSWVAPAVREVIAAWYEKKTGLKAKRPPYTWFPPKRDRD